MLPVNVFLVFAVVNACSAFGTRLPSAVLNYLLFVDWEFLMSTSSVVRAFRLVGAALAFLVAIGASGLSPSASHATTVTQSYTFSFSGFTRSGSPVDPRTRSFTITYDPSVFLIGGSL
jgi:hypothetical protein